MCKFSRITPLGFCPRTPILGLNDFSYWEYIVTDGTTMLDTEEQNKSPLGGDKYFTPQTNTKTGIFALIFRLSSCIPSASDHSQLLVILLNRMGRGEYCFL